MIPFSTAFTDVSTSCDDSFAASELCAAKTATWSATTAKPFPASPALAASMDAFKASRFVCADISFIVAIIFPISCDASLISFID